MRRIIMSLMMIAVAVLAVVGGTFAKFADSTTSVQNKFSAGNVSIQVNGAKSGAAIFAPENIKPGDTGTASVHLQNVGSIPKCSFVMEIKDVKNNQNRSLSSQIDIVVWEDLDNNGVQDSNEQSLYTGILKNTKIGEDADKKITKLDDTYIGFKWTFKESADSDYMGAECTANITFIANQP